MARFGAVSWETGGIVGVAGRRSAAPGVVGVEGCVGRDLGGSLDESAVSGSRMSGGKPGMGAGSGIGEEVVSSIGGNSRAIVVSVIGDGVAVVAVAGVGDEVATGAGVAVAGVGDRVTLGGVVTVPGVGDGVATGAGVAVAGVGDGVATGADVAVAIEMGSATEII